MNKTLWVLGAMASFAFSQSPGIDMVRSYVDTESTVSPTTIGELEAKLENGLSATLKTRITGKGRLFRINTSEIKKQVEAETGKKSPKIHLKMDLMNDRFIREIEIDRIDQLEGRTLLIGSVKGMPESEVHLVYYRGMISGRLTLGDRQHVILLRTSDEGVSKTFEINAKDLKYD
jgi:hypothetical protein